MENANVNIEDVNSYILKLSQLENTFEEFCADFEKLREESCEKTDYFDKIFENEIKDIIVSTDLDYQKLMIRNVVINGFFKMLNIKEEYKINCGNLGTKKELTKLWMHTILHVMSPIIPHFCEIMWRNQFMKILSDEEKKSVSEFLTNSLFPEVKPEDIDMIILKQNEYIKKVGSNLRSSYEKIQKKNKNKVIKKIYILCTEVYQDW